MSLLAMHCAAATPRRHRPVYRPSLAALSISAALWVLIGVVVWALTDVVF